jgi:hypothetical protein
MKRFAKRLMDIRSFFLLSKHNWEVFFLLIIQQNCHMLLRRQFQYVLILETSIFHY